MSRRANPTAIGLFLVGALVLTLGGIAALAGTSWLNPQSTFISYFPETVNGLEVGAPVKFQGVPVGRVTELMIQIELADNTFEVPVQYEVDLRQLTSGSGMFVNLDDPAVMAQQVAGGLRAQLQMESLVTGLLYVELYYRPDAPPAPSRALTPHPEIPTTPSLLAAFGTQAGSLVGDVLQILYRVNEMLEEVDMVEINRSVVASAQSIERLADSPEIRNALAEIPGLSDRFSSTMEEVERLAARMGESIDPLQAQLEGTSEEVTLTLQTLRQTLEETRAFLTPDAGVGYQLEEAMTSLAEAAEALRALARSLERNPDMLIRGREPGVR